MSDTDAGAADDGSAAVDAPPRKIDVPNAPSSTIGIGSTLGIGCLILVVLAVIILALLRSRGVTP